LRFEFGVYIFIVGVAAVFVTLVMVAAGATVLRRLWGVEPSALSGREKLKVAAISAAIQYAMGAREAPLQSAVSMDSGSRWLAVARSEALGIEVEGE
jgi:hypothetical protein